MSVVTTLQWITDIHNEQNNYWNELILLAIAQSQFTVKEKFITELYNGITLFRISLIENDSERNTSTIGGYLISTIDNILGLIEKICYIPVEFSFLQNDIISRKVDIDIQLENSRSIITAYLKSEFSIDVDYIETTSFMIDFENDIIIHKFIPFSHDYRIYESSKRCSYINQICNLNKLVGYRFLSDNPLIKIVADKYTDENFDKSNIKISSSLYLYKVVTSKDLVHYNKLLKLLEYYVNIGYFTIPKKLTILDYNVFENIYPEVALAWNVKLIDSWTYEDLQRIYCFQYDGFLDDIENFLQKSSSLINDGKLPICNFSNRWCQSLFSIRTLNEDVNEMNWMKFFYLIVKSYTELIADHPILFNYLDSVVLNPDFTITASFGTYLQYEQFQKILDNQFYNVNVVTNSYLEPSEGVLRSLLNDSSLSDTIDRLSIEVASSLTNALSIRWYWQVMDEKSNTLIIKSKDKYYIVVDTYKTSIKLITLNFQDDVISTIKLVEQLENKEENFSEDEEVNVELEEDIDKDQTSLTEVTDILEIKLVEDEKISETKAELQFENNFHLNTQKDKLVLKKLEEDNKLLRKYRHDFLKKLRQHYINCRNDEDVITREQISTMNILDLLEIIIVQDEDEQHCFSKEFLLKTGVYVDPATGYFLNENIVRIMKQQDFGVRGYFDYGILNGILDSIPNLPLLNIEKAKVDVNITDNYLTIDLLVNNQNLVNRSFVESYMTDEFTLMLAEIDLNLLDNDSKETKAYSMEQLEDFSGIFTELWKTGRLLSDWGFQMLLHYGKISRKSFKEQKSANMAVENDVYGTRFISRILEIYPH